jgi:hypothetical protein
MLGTTWQRNVSEIWREGKGAANPAKEDTANTFGFENRAPGSNVG